MALETPVKSIYSHYGKGYVLVGVETKPTIIIKNENTAFLEKSPGKDGILENIVFVV